MSKEGYWIIRTSLILMAITIVFFVMAPPVLNYPLTFAQATRVLQIIVPVFIGYVAIATRSATNSSSLETEATPLLRLLSRGPLYVFALAMLVIVGSFWYSNRPGSLPPGSGMSVDQLCWVVTFLMGLLSATTATIVGRAFGGT